MVPPERTRTMILTKTEHYKNGWTMTHEFVSQEGPSKWLVSLSLLRQSPTEVLPLALRSEGWSSGRGQPFACEDADRRELWSSRRGASRLRFGPWKPLVAAHARLWTMSLRSWIPRLLGSWQRPLTEQASFVTITLCRRN